MSDHRPPLFACVVVMIAVFLLPLYAGRFVVERVDKHVSEKDNEVAQLDRQIEMAKAARRKSAQFHEEVARLDVENDKLRAILPLQRNDALLQRMVGDAARAAGVTVVDLRAASENGTSEDAYHEVFYTASVRGSLPAIRDFLGDLANATQIIDVQSVALKPSGTDWAGPLQMKTFYSPRAAALR